MATKTVAPKVSIPKASKVSIPKAPGIKALKLSTPKTNNLGMRSYMANSKATKNVF